MLKKHKWKLIVSSLLILLTAIPGLLLGEEIPGKWVWLVTPLILLAVHWLCLFMMSKDPQNKEQTAKAFSMVFWIVPLIALFCAGILCAVIWGDGVGVPTLSMGFIGLVVVVIGNYLPKCKQNRVLGIKIKWTLQSEENWNATHRFGGKVWVISGILIMLCALLPAQVMPVVMAAVIVPVVLIPTVYSYVFYRKQVKAGAKFEKVSMLPKKAKWYMIISLSVLFVGTGILMFTGTVWVQFGDSSFTVQADYWEDMTVPYTAVEEVSYREGELGAVRTYGFGSAKLQMGQFQNEELGSFTLYGYTDCDACVLVRNEGKLLVLTGKTPAESKLIYEALLEKTQQKNPLS